MFANWVCVWSCEGEISFSLHFCQNFKRVFSLPVSVTFRRMTRRPCRSRSRASSELGSLLAKTGQAAGKWPSGLLSLTWDAAWSFTFVGWGNIGLHPHSLLVMKFHFIALVELQFSVRPLNSFLSRMAFVLQVKEESYFCWDTVTCVVFALDFTSFPYMWAVAVFGAFHASVLMYLD